MIDIDKREDAIRRTYDAAWAEGKECPECNGSGRLPGGRKVVHCFLGGIGADWDVESVVELIRSADEVRWVKHLFNHELLVLKEGEHYCFEVSRPVDVEQS